MNSQKKRNSELSRVLYCGVSVLALGIGMPAMAQDSQMMETVTVTGQRAAIQSAIKIKENADQIVDSIVADDAGKLPDRSITEVLQRVSGVTITHFNNLGNPDNYTVEGSGPTVRGLPGGTSTINGHNAFSANGGRQILWGDVPSELMAAVDVLKTYTPDQIEGGLGGTINLRTRMPFSFDDTKIAGAISASYGDLIKQARPRASIMGSTRWDTKWGEMGLLVDLSYDSNSYRNDSIQVEPYFPHTNVLENYTLNTSTTPPTPVQTGNTVYYMPGGFDYHTSFGTHDRGGVYAAFQWRPTDKLEVYVRGFGSVNHSNNYSYNYAASSGANRANITYTLHPTDSQLNTLGTNQLISVLSGGGTIGTSSPLYHVFDSGHNLVYANTYFDTGFINQNGGWVAGGISSVLDRCSDASKLCSTAATRTEGGEDYARTTDIDAGVTWTPNDRLTIKGVFDFIYSKSNQQGLSVEGDVIMPPYGVDLTGSYPTFVISDPSSLKVSSSYFWNNTMEHRAKNYGQEMQFTLDADYRLDLGIVKTIKVGVRGDLRTEHDNDTGYNWQPLSPLYTSPQHWWSEPAAKEDITLYQFPNFFRGAVNLPGPALFVSGAKVNMYDASYFQKKYNATPQANKAYDPYQSRHFKTANVAAYVRVDFAKEDVLGMAMSGNAGARLVYTDNHASGYWTTYGNTRFQFPASMQSTYFPGDPAGTTYSTLPQNIAITGGRTSWTLLPAFNVQFMPNDKIHIRFAGSITAEQPNFAGISGSNSVTTQSSSNLTASNFNFQGDNPRLKPQLGRNFDVSFEWYGNGSELHLSGFYKSIKHKTVSGYELDILPWAIGAPTVDSGNNCITSAALNWACQFPNGSKIVNLPTYRQTSINSNKEALIRGVEFGFTKYFDWEFVPSYLKGFGFSGNYTYIDSKAPGSYSFDMFGNNISNHMPIAGLSKHSFNAQLMYDRDPVSFRLAYNWRNKYLMSASGWNTQGYYPAAPNYINCPANFTAADGFGGNLQDGQCHYSLPVWSKSFGSLDAGLDYKVDDNFTLSVQSQNLLNTTAKTTMGYGAQEHGRSWFMADRRVSIDLRFNY